MGKLLFRFFFFFFVLLTNSSFFWDKHYMCSLHTQKQIMSNLCYVLSMLYFPKA